MAVDSPLCASCPLYKRERAAPVGPPPLSLGRLKFNSGTAARRGCQIVPRSLVRSLLLSLPSVIERSIYTARAAREDFRRGNITALLRLYGENCGVTQS